MNNSEALKRLIRIPSIEEKQNEIDVTLNNNINEVNNLKHTLYKNTVDVTLLDGYEKSDISTVLNSITFQENTKYILNDGKVECKSMLVIDLPKGAGLEVHGEILAWESFMEIRMSLMGSTLYIDDLKAKSGSVCQKGVHIKRGAECNITINKISGFNKCLLLQPTQEPIAGDFDNSDWLQYNKINFFNFIGDIAIDICCNFKHTWINENTFNGGGLGGRVNVYMHKDYIEEVPSSQINNNKFYNLGVQSSEECIKINNNCGESNYFYNLRMHEQDWGKTALNINDKGSDNYYECATSVAYESIKLGKKSKYDGILQSNKWETYTETFPIVGYGAYGNDNLEKRAIIKKTPYIYNVSFKYGECVLYTVSESIRCSMSDGQIGNIRLQNSMFFDSNNFTLSKIGYSNSTLNVFTPTGKKITLTENGLYMFMLGNSNDYFECFKIASSEPSTPR